MVLLEASDPAVVVPQPVSQSGVVVLDGQSFTAGHIPTTVSSTHIAVCTNGDLIRSNSIIHNILLTAIPASVSCFDIDSEEMTLSAAHLLAEAKTFAGGDQDPTIDRKVVSLDSTALQIGTSNVPLGLESSPLPSVVTLAAVQMVSPVASGGLVECATLTSNGLAVTITGTQLSFRNDGLVTRTSTIPITLPAHKVSFSTLTTPGETITALSNGVAIGGSKLTGTAPAIMNSGTTVSAGSDGLAIGTSMVSYAGLGLAPTQGLGGFTLGALNGGSTTLNTSSSSNETDGQCHRASQLPDSLPWERRKGQAPGQRSTGNDAHCSRGFP